MANYAFIDWKDNMEILDETPSIYYPVVCEGRSPEEIQRMEEKTHFRTVGRICLMRTS